MKCKKCQSENIGVRPNPKNNKHTDLYCKDCGAWQKFANADEIRMYSVERFTEREKELIKRSLFVIANECRIQRKYELTEELLNLREKVGQLL